MRPFSTTTQGTISRCFVLCLVFVGARLAAEDSEFDESGSDLAMARLSLTQERKLLKWALEDNRASGDVVDSLTRLRRVRDRVERDLAESERLGEEHMIDKFSEQTEVVELELEQAEQAFELLAELRDLNRFLGELLGDNLTSFVEEGFELRSLQQRRLDHLAALFDAYHGTDDEDDDDNEHADNLAALEATAESLEHAWSIGRERLELRVERHWARVDGDQQREAELKRELDAATIRDDERGRRHERDHRPRVQPVKISSAEIDAAVELDFERSILPLLKSNCFSCHDADSASGDFNLAALAATRPLVVNRQHWINATQQLKLRSMPPQDADQPTDDDRRKLIAWLTHAIERFDYTTVYSPGFEPTRRLTHEEYNNTIRDLFGVDVRPANRFPIDFTATSGFDNSANSLFLQPVLMERYFHATEELLDELLPISQSKTRPRRATETSSPWRNVLQGRAPRDALVPFLTRVFRRPLSPEQSRKWLTRFDSLQTLSNSAEDAFRKVVGVALVSPQFLLLSEVKNSTERDHANPTRPYRVSQHDLASRLSYFLWASTPDAELMSLADTGRLSDRSILREQVERLLNDRRSEALGRLFLGQWLGVSKLDRLRPDQIDNPWATDALIDSMKAESALFFNSLVQENAPIERLVDADYTFVNEDLAGHYLIDHVRGPEMRRVKTDGFGRGGILGHASILAITSFPGRTSPVLRGNWILTDLLGTPPPPPPPNVSQFDEELEELEDLSPRARLEAHRNNPNCYVCHNEIDPLGFALDQYEWFGRHRPRRDGRRVDARGQLPDGTVVVGLDGLKSVIATTRREDLVQQISRKMLSYALGRQLEYYDEATVQQIVQKVEADDRQIRSLVHAIVSSDAFQMKESPQAATEGLTYVR